MPEELQKQAGSLGDTLKEYWAQAAPYHPGILGAAGGAALGGFGSMGRRANENPRQRALRIIRNAAAGGLLGGAGSQLLVPGVKNFLEGTVSKKEGPSEPGFFSSIPARLGYVGGTLGVGNIARRRRLLSSLVDLSPRDGLGKITFDLDPKDHFRQNAHPSLGGRFVPRITHTIDLGSSVGVRPDVRRAAAAVADLELRQMRNNFSDGSWKNFMRALSTQRALGQGHAPEIASFVDANYSRGRHLGPIGLKGALRHVNFLGGTGATPWGRRVGMGGSLGFLGLAATAPEWANKYLERGGEAVEQGVTEKLRGAFTAPEPTKTEDMAWYDPGQLTKGRRFF